ncbi:hypothetical protein [uncultured Actinomyces sp.]|uniref:hypothetical protein n=1 Tax=uncultured Actinomyces sp. TaxID=249061 RepID=UPI00261A1496|nr:hypothetical protein [uncultured Actinomyces sp.]
MSYELWVFDSSGTITEESCKALPQARNNAQTSYSTDPQRKTCSIEATFFRLNNPYVEANEDGSFTFVTRPVRFEDFKVSFPEGTSYLTRDLSFAGISMKISKMSPGGTVSDGHETASMSGGVAILAIPLRLLVLFRLQAIFNRRGGFQSRKSRPMSFRQTLK